MKKIRFVLKSLAIFCFMMSTHFYLFGQAVSNHIHIDQFGYTPLSHKVAVLSDPQVGFNAAEFYSPGTVIQVIHKGSGDVVLEGTAQEWNNGQTHDQSGDRGWWFDFSSVTSPGTYYILDKTQQLKSFDFEISDSVYDELMKAAGRMFYYNRCNTPKQTPNADPRWTDEISFDKPLQDYNCRYVYDRNNVSLEKDLSGGWFDAGDYNKYVTFASNVIHDLLSAYEENPDAFTDHWDIPESDNSIPDVIDEVRWELEWLKKMQNDDGSVHIKMGSIDHGHNAGSPPSVNTDQRFYGPECSSAAIAVAGVFAHAAVVFRTIEGLEGEAAALADLARVSWDHVSPLLSANNLDTQCDDGTIKAGDADRSAEDQRMEALTAAVYLYIVTAESEYETYLVNHINDASMISTTWWGPYTNSTNEALLRYATLSNVNANLANIILTSPYNHVNQNGDPFYGFHDGDLYRSYVPAWAYHWGSNNPKAQFGVLNLLMTKYGIVTEGNESTFLQKAEEQLHYFHGVNPLNLVYLSNMYEYGAENCANEMYHIWFYDGTKYDHALNSTNGPAPGYVMGGANASFSISEISPPSGQPAQKAYRDWNTGWPENSWEITEPAIYYQSAYIRLLANYARPQSTTSIETVGNRVLDISVFPSPANDFVTVLGCPDSASIKVLNNSGQCIKSVKADGPEFQISLKDLSPGIYHIIVHFKGATYSEKILKI